MATETTSPTLFTDLILEDDPKVLCAYGGNIHSCNRSGFTGLMVAATHRLARSLEWCIANGVGRMGVDKTELTQKRTALMFACVGLTAGTGAKGDVVDDPACARKLIQAGANPLLGNIKGRTPLHCAVKSGLVKIATFLASLKSQFVNAAGETVLTVKDAKGKTALDCARKRGDLAMMKVLEEAATNEGCAVVVPVLKDYYCRDLAYTASGPRVKLRRVGDTSTDLLTATLGDYLCLAARRGELGPLEKFRFGMNFLDSDGRNIVMSACMARQVVVIDWYLSTCPDVPAPQLLAVDDCLNSCAHFAASNYPNAAQADDCVMRKIVEAGSPANSANCNGITPLHVAAQHGFEPIVRFLLSRQDVCPGYKSLDGHTAAFLARENGHPHVADVIEAEIKAREAPASRVFDSLVHDVLKQGDDLEKLQAVRGDPAVRDSNGRTCVMYAAQFRREACLEWLLTHVNSNYKKCNKADKGHTALMYACLPPSEAAPFVPVSALRRSVCARLLLAYCTTSLLNRQSSTGNTALHYCCLHGYEETAAALLTRRDIDVTLINSAGRTAEQVAEEAKHPRIASKIRKWSLERVLHEAATAADTYTTPAVPLSDVCSSLLGKVSVALFGEPFRPGCTLHQEVRSVSDGSSFAHVIAVALGRAVTSAVQKALGAQEAALRSQLMQACGETAKLRRELADKDSELVRIRSELADRDSELVRIRSELADKDAELVRSELADKDSELVRIRSELADKDSELVRIRSEVVPLKPEPVGQLCAEDLIIVDDDEPVHETTIPVPCHLVPSVLGLKMSSLRVLAPRFGVTFSTKQHLADVVTVQVVGPPAGVASARAYLQNCVVLAETMLSGHPVALSPRGRVVEIPILHSERLFTKLVNEGAFCDVTVLAPPIFPKALLSRIGIDGQDPVKIATAYARMCEEVASVMGGALLQKGMLHRALSTGVTAVFVDATSFPSLEPAKLDEFAVNSRRVLKKVIAGTNVRDPDMWSSLGYVVTTRTTAGKEFLHAQIMDVISMASGSGNTLVLVTGDAEVSAGPGAFSTFPKCCAWAVKSGWTVEVLVPRGGAMFECYFGLAALSRGALRVRFLEDADM